MLNEIISKLSSPLFSDRETIEEATEYFNMLIDTIKKSDKITVYTAVGVLLNTIANELKKVEEKEK